MAHINHGSGSSCQPLLIYLFSITSSHNQPVKPLHAPLPSDFQQEDTKVPHSTPPPQLPHPNLPLHTHPPTLPFGIRSDWRQVPQVARRRADRGRPTQRERVREGTLGGGAPCWSSGSWRRGSDRLTVPLSARQLTIKVLTLHMTPVLVLRVRRVEHLTT